VIIKRKLIESRSIAGKSHGQAKILLAESRELTKELKGSFQRMNQFRLAADAMRIFVKKLVASEILLICLLFILYPMLTILLQGFVADYLGDHFLNLLRDRSVQKNVLFIVSVFVAPFLAFAGTIRALTR
jgi:hypothetical protein